MQPTGPYFPRYWLPVSSHFPACYLGQAVTAIGCRGRGFRPSFRPMGQRFGERCVPTVCSEWVEKTPPAWRVALTECLFCECEGLFSLSCVSSSGERMLDQNGTRPWWCHADNAWDGWECKCTHQGNSTRCRISYCPCHRKSASPLLCPLQVSSGAACLQIERKTNWFLSSHLCLEVGFAFLFGPFQLMPPLYCIFISWHFNPKHSAWGLAPSLQSWWDQASRTQLWAWVSGWGHFSFLLP